MLMNSKGRLARIHYLPGTIRILSSGDFVLCAVTGQQIPLADLKYWSAERQEAYATAQASLAAHRPDPA